MDHFEFYVIKLLYFWRRRGGPVDAGVRGEEVDRFMYFYVFLYVYMFEIGQMSVW